MFNRGLDPVQDGGEDDDGGGVDAPYHGQESLLHLGLPVVAEEGGQKEGDVDGHEDGEGTPPAVEPVEGGSGGQKDLDDGKTSSIHDRKENTVVDAEDLLLRVFGQQLAHDQTGDREHQAQLDADADEQQVGSASRHGPEGIAAEVFDQGVEDLVEPVYAVEGETGGDALVILLGEFIRVDVHDGCQQRDDIPLEICTITKERLCLLGEF